MDTIRSLLVKPTFISGCFIPAIFTAWMRVLETESRYTVIVTLSVIALLFVISSRFSSCESTMNARTASTVLTYSTC
ncbi:hypothetical protein EDD16DRAFT_1650489 [Pisolithus croceorrhizus]|nr:hypothetical protein EDD16DRAFT_1650489 [Pisolithus croceorrhizus]